MTEKEKMLAGQLYNPGDKELRTLHLQAQHITEQLNAVPASDNHKRIKLAKELFGTAGDYIILQPGFHCDYGCNIHVGDNFFANYNCVMLDCAEIRIGNNCMLGPQVGIYTASHPLLPDERRSLWEYAYPVTIGSDCWIGGHATILPGVTLGDHVVVAAGAVVTKSFGDNVVIGGNPARILKTLELK